MLLITCPWCGPRNEIEFRNGGEAGKYRPADMVSLKEEQWYAYVYLPSNTKGWLRERWWHEYGCQRWFKLDRNTHTHECRNIVKSAQ